MKSYIQQQLGKKIQTLRKIKGYNQEVFAEKIGIATNTLSSIETGNAFMTAITLEKIAEILEVTPRDLFTFQDETNEEMYKYVRKRLEFVRTDCDRLKILYNVAKALY